MDCFQVARYFISTGESARWQGQCSGCPWHSPAKSDVPEYLKEMKFLEMSCHYVLLTCCIHLWYVMCVCVPCLPFVGEIYAHTCTGSVSVNIWLLMSYGRNLQLSMERISCRDPEIFIDSLAHSAAHTAANCPDIVVGWDVLSDSRNDMKHIDATSTIYQGCTISTAMTIRCGILTFIYLHIYLFVHLFTCVSMYLPIDLFYGKLSLGLFFLWNPWFLRPCPCDGMLLSSKVCWDHSRDGSEVTASHVGSLPGVATWPGEMWGTQSARWFRPKMRVAVDLFWVGTTWNQKKQCSPFCVDSDVVDIW